MYLEALIESITLVDAMCVSLSINDFLALKEIWGSDIGDVFISYTQE